MAYDELCEELAWDFLNEVPKAQAEYHAPLLAQHIQDAIESYLSGIDIAKPLPWSDETPKEPR